ncbi:hypothetical protein [Candidatus Marithrix sp. Canyon 246]|uniref:hypothetical protein n=1 Tax=Candidatus Marithrix sp. Canyon 246 TaxID=1827136 RepID=UPI00084A20C5|nr:hypothetical protein [Candidatus Marithrix sp. Canyon 246]
MKTILYLSKADAQLFTITKNRIEIQTFQNTEKGETDFIRCLNFKKPIFVLVDIIKENYQNLTMPHVSARDHRNLIKHNIKKLFNNNTYTHSVIQGREQKGRRDDKVLLMALNNPEILQPWLNLLVSYKIPFTGIYSLPLLSELLLKSLPKNPATLLITHNNDSLRQSVFVNQKLQLSRLVSFDTNIAKSQFLLQQFNNIKHYLISVIKVNIHSLSIIILTDKSLLNTLHQELNIEDSQSIYILDINDLAKKLGLYNNNIQLQHLIAYQLVRHRTIINHYATAREMRYFFYRQLRIRSYFTSVLLVVVAIITNVIYLQNTAIQKQEINQIAEKTLNRRNELIQLAKITPNLPYDIEIIRQIVDTGWSLKQQQKLPHTAWEKLSHVLNDHPKILLENLEWINNPSEELIRLNGKISRFKGNYSRALKKFNRFVKDLGKQHWDVNIITYPYPNDILQGQIGIKTDKIRQASFVIEISDHAN